MVLIEKLPKEADALRAALGRQRLSSVIDGDGYALALEAGAELVDMEFVQFFPIGHLAPRLVGMDPIMWDPFRYKLGGRLLNGRGEEFIHRYGSRDEGRYVVTRDVATYAIVKEVAAGRGSPHGGAWLSFEHCSEAELRAAVIATGKIAYQSGLMISNDGNISARMADGHILMTPSGVCKGRIDRSDLLVVDLASRGEDVLISVRGRVKARLTRAAASPGESDRKKWVTELRRLQKSCAAGGAQPSIEELLAQPGQKHQTRVHVCTGVGPGDLDTANLLGKILEACRQLAGEPLAFLEVGQAVLDRPQSQFFQIVRDLIDVHAHGQRLGMLGGEREGVGQR